LARGYSERKTIHRAKEAFAWVEYEMDGFLVSVFRTYASVLKQKSIPLGMSKKLDLLFELFCALPRLREFGLQDGSLDLNRMNYWLSEIAEHRNHIVHGHLNFTWTDEDDVEYTFRRYIREEGAIGNLGQWNWRTYRSYVREQIRQAEMFAIFFRDACRFLEDEIDRDHYSALAKRQARQREWWIEEGQHMNLGFPDNIAGFGPLIRGEMSPV
jgi:hypothetical protein